MATFAEVHPCGVCLGPGVEAVLEQLSMQHKAVTFDEITLADQPSSFHPADVRLQTFISRNIALDGCGICSAAMDSVTEGVLALEMARNGGMGIVHRNLSAEEQADIVKWVWRKIHFGGMIDRPISFTPDDYYSVVVERMNSRGFTFTSFPIVDGDNRLVGLLTRDEMDFVSGDSNPQMKDIMKPLAAIVTTTEDTNSDRAYDIMREKRVKKLPVLDGDGRLVGMYVWGDVKDDQSQKEKFSLDKDGHFLVGAAIGLGRDDFERAKVLVNKADCKLLVLDSSHGGCRAAVDQVEALRREFGDRVDIMVGNVASYESAKFLLEQEYRPDSLKVGIGPGSICTTRQVTGHGVPQVTAIYEVWKAVRDYGKTTGYYVPIIADGGIKSSGDIVKALAVGASGVMLGSVFAGTLESPGQIVVKNGRRYKQIRGMGSRSAMESRSGSRARYYKDSSVQKTEVLTPDQKQKMVPEGVEGLVELKGNVCKVMNDLLGGVQSGLAHSGCDSINEFRKHAKVWVQSYAGVAEGRPHSITDIRH